MFDLFLVKIKPVRYSFGMITHNSLECLSVFYIHSCILLLTQATGEPRPEAESTQFTVMHNVSVSSLHQDAYNLLYKDFTNSTENPFVTSMIRYVSGISFL
jgi:hypothetical protein